MTLCRQYQPDHILLLTKIEQLIKEGAKAMIWCLSLLDGPITFCLFSQLVYSLHRAMVVCGTAFDDNMPAGLAKPDNNGATSASMPEHVGQPDVDIKDDLVVQQMSPRKGDTQPLPMDA